MHPLPELARRDTLRLEEIWHVVVREPLQVVGQVGARIVDLAHKQKLPVEVGAHFYAFFP